MFHDILPTAKIVGFEANPLNFQRMKQDAALSGRIVIYPWAVSNTDGTATFYIAEANYEAPETVENNLGISSLLVHPNVKTAANVEVQTVRLDTVLRNSDYIGYQSVALWIDAESAEYFILEGMQNAAERVKVVQVETAKKPMRIGQRTYDEVMKLMNSLGFEEIGSGIGEKDNWGDVVFVQRNLVSSVRGARLKAAVTKGIRIHNLAAFLKNRSPWLYGFLRKLFVKAI